jgi:ferredoxin-NADP reductase
MVKAAIAALAKPIAYLAGPPAMVAATREILVAAGVDDDDIRAEEFFGY